MSDSPLVVAVIDDDASIRRLLSLVIRSCGDVPVEAATFAEGQLVLREYPWDIAVIDRQLPDGDGLELCREASGGPASDEASHRRLIFFSSSDSAEEKLRGYGVGADDYIGKPVNPTELQARLQAIRRTVLTQKALLNRLGMLEQVSVIDGLTEVYNRRFFDSEARRLFDIASRHERPLTAAMLDLDHFKVVNDTWGHQAGDLVLREVSTAIAAALRSSDILARYGGEEFTLLFPETTVSAAVPIAERIRAAVEELRIEGNFGSIEITLSIGLAGLPSDELRTPSLLIDAADKALYVAKMQGRNCVHAHGLLSDPHGGFYGATDPVAPS